MYTYNGNIPANVKKIMQDCVKKCKAINIPISNDIDFFMMDGERTYGECIDKHIIKISKNLINDDEIENTVFHELIHTVDRADGHDAVFYYFGRMIQKAYGQEITRVGNKAIKSDIKSSKRRYFTKAEWQANPDLLVALTREGESEPLWFVKKNSIYVRKLNRCTSKGKKIVIFN